MIQLFDRVPLENVRETADGYLTAVAPVARTGIQIYAGYEVDPDNKHGLRDRATVRVNRSKKDVFSDATLHSFAHRPVTNDHPPVLVTADNWKQYSVGQTGDEVDARDGKFVRVPLCLMDAGVINDYRAGKKELSMGYQVALDYNPGVNEDGEEYDISQTDMRMNHLAVVHRARGGDKLKIGDQQEGGRPMTDKTQSVVVDGISIETTAQGAQAIAKLQGLLSDSADRFQAELAAKDAAIAAKDKELATKDAALADANAKVPDQAAMDAAVAARSQLIADAKAVVSDFDAKGLSDADVRKAVVTKALGDAAVAGKSQAYLDARFDILLEEAGKGNALDTALGNTVTRLAPATDSAAHDAAHTASINSLNDWRNQKAS